MTMVELRHATAEDVEALAGLHHDTVSVAYREWFPPPAPAVDVLCPLWEAEVREAHAVFIAVDGADVVGSAVARVGGWLGRVHVNPSRWGQGIGQQLHDAAITVFRDAGYGDAHLWVIEQNLRAIQLYERNGWVLVPDERHEELDVVEVQYRLDL